MRMVLALGLVGLLAACGADGAPIRPTYGAGVTISSDGVSGNAAVGVRKGPFSVTLSN